jgi:hypothetical protein
MGYLKDKIIKFKKLQKLAASSLVIILPNNWLEEMNWTRQTILQVSWHPSDERIVIEPADIPEKINDLDEVEVNEEVSDTESG